MSTLPDYAKQRLQRERAVAKAQVLRKRVAALGVCLLCGEFASYRNGFCGPCWNRNYDFVVKQDLGPMFTIEPA